jgi:hypothetical protein
LSISSMKMMPAAIDRGARHALHVDQLAFLFLRERLQRFGQPQLPLLRAPLEEAGQHVLDVDVHLLDRGPRDDLERREALLACLDLDLLVVEAARAKLLAELLARALPLFPGGAGLIVEPRGGRQGREQQVQDALFGPLARLLADLRAPLVAHHADADLHQVADHRLDVAADVADLGELGGLDLQERGLRQPGQPPGDLRLADAGRPDHQDVLRRDVVGELGRQLLPAGAVAQRDRHGALRLRLPDDVLVELGDDLAGCQGLGGAGGGFREIDRQSRVPSQLDAAGAAPGRIRAPRS